MDFENLAELYAVYPEAKNKIHMLSAFAEGKQRNREIADPYYGDEKTTRRCYHRYKRVVYIARSEGRRTPHV